MIAVPRLLVVNSSCTFGGAEKVLWNVLAPWRVEAKEKKVLLLLPGSGPFSAVAAGEGICNAFFNMGRRLEKVGDSPVRGRFGFRKLINLGVSTPGLIQAIFQIRQIANNYNPEVVLANGFKAQILCALAIKRSLPLIWYFQDYVSTRNVVSRILPRLVRSKLFLVADSNSVADDLRIIIPKKEISIWNNTVDTESFKPDSFNITKGEGHRNKKLNVGLVATFARWKGHETFLRAVKLINDTIGDVVEFFVVGGPVYQSSESQWSMEDLERMAESIGVKNAIKIIGFKNNIVDVYRRMDVVVHASTAPEPFGQVIIEAMACGKPVVVARHGGAGEIGRHGVDLIHHDPGDFLSLANAILSLVGEESFRQKIGLAARETAVNCFDISRVFQYWTKFFEEVNKTC